VYNMHMHASSCKYIYRHLFKRMGQTMHFDMARKKQMVTLTLKPELVERLKAWIAQQRLPPAQNAVVELAIEEFLDRNETKKSDELATTSTEK
jgi:hypothetical protein